MFPTTTASGCLIAKRQPFCRLCCVVVVRGLSPRVYYSDVRWRSATTSSAALRCLAFCRMMRRRWSSAIPHSLISSKDRKQPRQVRPSSRQQFRTHGDWAEPSISLIDVKHSLAQSPIAWLQICHTNEWESGNASQGQSVCSAHYRALRNKNTLPRNSSRGRTDGLKPHDARIAVLGSVHVAVNGDHLT